MSALQRTAIGGFSVNESVTLEQLQDDELETHLKPLSTAVATLPTITLSDDEAKQIAFGLLIRRHDLQGNEVGALMPDGSLAAILQRRTGGYAPARNFVAKQ